MRFNPQLKKELEKFQNYVILVEGKKDVASIKSLGFAKVFAIHKTGVPLREGIEQIVLNLSKKERVCILTDFDKQGKKLYMKTKTILHELGIRVDSSLRGILLKSGISHIEGFSKFMRKFENLDRG